ncbi:MAG: hypothetical protein FJ095_13405 [Deltaproteobacteria bacterium]|nr:hypothetical protein [Deltaproteobacteria bacterium]
MSDESSREQGAPEGDEGSMREVDEEAMRVLEDELGADALDDVEVRELLRRALDRERPAEDASVLPDVQRRLRDETKGHYFADGWGTTPAVRETYLVTAILLLALLALAWLALGPRALHRL